MHRYTIAAVVFSAACVQSAQQGGPQGPERSSRLVPQVQPGPANGAKPGKILVLGTNCGSIEFKCPKNYIAAVDSIVRTSLEFSGLAVVSAESLRLETRQRHEEHESQSSKTVSESHTHEDRSLAPDIRVHSNSATESASERDLVVLDGPGFDDMTVTEKEEVMAQAGTDSVVLIRVTVGALAGAWTPDQSVEVMVRLAVNKGDTMAWASRCMASSNDFDSVTAALEGAARCAVFGGTGR